MNHKAAPALSISTINTIAFMIAVALKPRSCIVSPTTPTFQMSSTLTNLLQQWFAFFATSLVETNLKVDGQKHYSTNEEVGWQHIGTLHMLGVASCDAGSWIQVETA